MSLFAVAAGVCRRVARQIETRMNFLKNLKWSLVEDFITQEKVLLLPSQLAFQGRPVADSQTSSIFHLFNQLSPNDLEEVLQQYGVGFEDLGPEKSHVTLALRVLLLLIDVSEEFQAETYVLEEPMPEAPATPIQNIPEVRIEPKIKKKKKKTFKRVEKPRFERKKVCSWKKCKRTTITPCLNENCAKIACSNHQFDLCPKVRYRLN